MSRHLLPQCVAIFSALLLAACSPKQTPDHLETQLQLIRQQTTAATPVGIAIQHVDPLSYDHDGDETPFGIRAVADAATDIDIDRRPVQRGPKQYLEEFPLETIRLVGTIAADGKTEAWVQANGVVHRARPGDYLGQHFGVIRYIAENSVELEELVDAGKHDWESRSATMTLQGGG